MRTQISKPERAGSSSLFSLAVYGDGLESDLLAAFEWTESKVESVSLDRGRSPGMPKEVPDIVLTLRISGRKATKAAAS